jgi:hypothetical protein
MFNQFGGIVESSRDVLLGDIALTRDLQDGRYNFVIILEWNRACNMS